MSLKTKIYIIDPTKFFDSHKMFAQQILNFDPTNNAIRRVGNTVSNLL